MRVPGPLKLNSPGEVIRSPTLVPFYSCITRPSDPFRRHRLEHLLDNPVRRNTLRLGLKIEDEPVTKSRIGHCLQVICRQVVPSLSRARTWPPITRA